MVEPSTVAASTQGFWRLLQAALPLTDCASSSSQGRGFGLIMRYGVGASWRPQPSQPSEAPQQDELDGLSGLNPLGLLRQRDEAFGAGERGQHRGARLRQGLDGGRPARFMDEAGSQGLPAARRLCDLPM